MCTLTGCDKCVPWQVVAWCNRCVHWHGVTGVCIGMMWQVCVLAWCDRCAHWHDVKGCVLTDCNRLFTEIKGFVTHYENALFTLDFDQMAGRSFSIVGVIDMFSVIFTIFSFFSKRSVIIKIFKTLISYQLTNYKLHIVMMSSM